MIKTFELLTYGPPHPPPSPQQKQIKSLFRKLNFSFKFDYKLIFFIYDAYISILGKPHRRCQLSLFRNTNSIWNTFIYNRSLDKVKCIIFILFTFTAIQNISPILKCLTINYLSIFTIIYSNLTNIHSKGAKFVLFPGLYYTYA